MLPSTLDIMWPMHQQSLELLHPTVKEKMHLQENTLFDPDLRVKVTRNVAQCPLHHVTYAPTEFEVTTSKDLGGEAYTRKFNIWPWPWGQGHTKYCPVPSTSCDLFSYKVCSCYVKRGRRRCIYKKIQYLTFDLNLGVKVTRNVTQYPLHHVTFLATTFEVAMSNRLGGDTFTRKYIIWPLTLTLSPSTLYIMWPTYLQSCYLLRFRRRYIYKKWRTDARTDRQTDDGPFSTRT